MTLWTFDFDGTLSPLVPKPSAAALHPACRRMLQDLAAVGGFRCAVLSSRAIADLESRVDVRGLYLGGGSGMEWRLPDGSSRQPGAEQEQLARRVRKDVLPEVVAWGRLPGVVVEDKRWSIAVHTRHAGEATRRRVADLLDRWRPRHAIRVFPGPEVFEIQLLPGVDKAFGVRALCGLVDFDPRVDRLVYAGDDDNDAEAMKLALTLGGDAVAVGERVRPPGVETVPGPPELARRIRRMAGLPPDT
jgi:trehalose 6-phosphate phosphatase